MRRSRVTPGHAHGEQAPPNGQHEAQPAAPPGLRRIDRDMIGTLSAWGTYLGLPGCCLKRECRLGRLTSYKRGGKLCTTGEAILEWLRGGQVKRRRRAEATSDPEVDKREQG
jgi:hypothetical protein